jgi:hypothetical protein
MADHEVFSSEKDSSLFWIDPIDNRVLSYPYYPIEMPLVENTSISNFHVGSQVQKHRILSLSIIIIAFS